MAEYRSALLELIRTYFRKRDYLEVDTPLLSPVRIPESTIELFTTVFGNPFRSDLPLGLIPSPEIWMKRLLAEGFPSCFQITKSFRNAEQLGRHHNPEFTMLEWYTLGADYKASIDVTLALLAALDGMGGGGETAGVLESIDRPAVLSMEEAFSKYAGIELGECGDMEGLKRCAGQIGIEADGDGWEELFNKIFLSRVEPEFQRIPILFLCDYPVQIPCLAKAREGSPVRERWELYLNGIEIANCFTEMRNPEEVAAFMEGEMRGAGKTETPAGREPQPDRELPKVSGSMPPCSGVALGVDRLIMALTGAEHIREVLLFPFEDFM